MSNKSTLNAYTNASLAVATNAAIPFSNAQGTGCSIRFTPGSTQVTIATPGLYEIIFNGTGFTSGVAGNIIVQLRNNDVAVPGATTSAASTAAADVESLSFSTILEVCPSCCAVNNRAHLTVVNTGVATTYTNVHLSVIKLA